MTTDYTNPVIKQVNTILLLQQPMTILDLVNQPPTSPTTHITRKAHRATTLFLEGKVTETEFILFLNSLKAIQ